MTTMQLTPPLSRPQFKTLVNSALTKAGKASKLKSTLSHNDNCGARTYSLTRLYLTPTEKWCTTKKTLILIVIFSLRKFQVHTFESYEEQGTNQMRKFKLSKIHTFESYERAKATQRGSAVLMLGTILRSLSNSEHDNTPQWDNQTRWDFDYQSSRIRWKPEQWRRWVSA